MKRALLFLIPTLCILAVTVCAADFTDVPEGHWAHGEISQAAAAGVVTGYADGSFRPGGQVTAAHFCTFLSRSVLAEEYAAAPEAPGWTRAMNACAPVLTGTEVEELCQANGGKWGDFISRPLSRCDMAAILYNVLTLKEAPLPTLEVRLAGQGKIGDWDQIPGRYQVPVATCYALGLLNGRSDGRFGGSDGLSRAQACVVWSRLLALLPDEDAAPDAAQAAGMPAFGLREGETVQQMMDRVNGKTPRYRKGFLPNGKPRNDENVLALLDLVKAGCPDGTVWTSVDRYSYTAPSMGTGRGCLAFGMAVSDYLFGEDAPLTQNRNFRNLSIGDVIHIKGGGADRVLVLTGLDRDNDAYTACELISGDKVDWSGWGPLSEFVDSSMTTIYSRG